MRERVEFGGRNKREIRKGGKEKNAEETRVRKKAREREKEKGRMRRKSAAKRNRRER